MQRRLPKSGVSAVYVNYPEPPQQTGSADYTHHSHHMLRTETLRGIHAVLKPGLIAGAIRYPNYLIIGGEFTVVTDNKWFGELLLRAVAEICDTHGSSLFEAAPSIAGGAAVMEYIDLDDTWWWLQV